MALLPKRRDFYILSKTMDKVQKTSDSFVFTNSFSKQLFLTKKAKVQNR